MNTELTVVGSPGEEKMCVTGMAIASLVIPFFL